MKKQIEREPDREIVIRDLRGLAEMAVSPHIKETCTAAATLIERDAKGETGGAGQ